MIDHVSDIVHSTWWGIVIFVVQRYVLTVLRVDVNDASMDGQSSDVGAPAWYLWDSKDWV